MNDKLDAIKGNSILSLRTLPKDRIAIGYKSIYQTKKNSNGKIARFKVGIVDKAYSKI